MRHHLRHLGVQALAHLGAAVVHQHRAVVSIRCTSAPAWLKCLTLKEMPNFTGVSARPRFSTGLVALNAATGARRAW